MKRMIIYAILAVLVFGGNISAEELGLREIFDSVLLHDDSVQLAEESIESAYQQYQITRSQGLPSLSLNTEPLYGVGMRRDFSFDEFPPETRTTVTNSFNLGLGFSQLLPTGGVLSAGIDDTFSYSLQLAEDDLEQSASLRQQPGFSLALTQPLFVDGKLIDTGLLKASNEIAELGWRQQQISARITTNARLYRAAQLYLQLLSIDRSRLYLEESIGVAKQQLEQTVLDRDQGRASENQVLALEVALNRRQEQLLDNELRRLQAEHQLGQMIHRRDVSTIVFTDSVEPLLNRLIKTLSPIDPGAAQAEAAEANPELALRRLNLDSTSLQDRLNNTEDVPNLSLSFVLNPRYPDEREDSESFAASFSDFFEEDAGVDLNFGLNIEIPLTGRKKKEAREAADESAKRTAELNLGSSKNTITDNIALAARKDSIFQKRIDLLSVDMEYNQSRLQREQQLLDLNSTTELQVGLVRLDLAATENQLWQTRADRLLNLFDLAVLMGRDIENLLSQ